MAMTRLSPIVAGAPPDVEHHRDRWDVNRMTAAPPRRVGRAKSPRYTFDHRAAAAHP